MSKRTRKLERSEQKAPPTPKEPVVHKRDLPIELAKTRSWRRLAVPLLSILVIGIIAFVLYNRSQTPPLLSETFTSGSAQYCAANSKFIQSLGFTGISAYDTRSRFVEGVALRELDPNGNIINTHQDATWDDAGYLGALQNDEFGNVYLIPVPFISVLENPPEKANTIWRIDTETGKMEPFIDLPAAVPVTPQNLFGLLDLTYDCDTHMLYASSVLGSTQTNMVGRIFQIDPTTREVKSILDGIDAIGLGIFNDLRGKRLYIGLTRSPEIYSVGLNERGDIGSDLRYEMALTDVSDEYADDRARSIVFQSQTQLVIKTLKFNYNLVAPSETRQTILVYAYDSNTDSWLFTRSQITSE